ncbi:EXS-domain-containing protein [Xylariaceae sp. FL1651]|nr:EXS-domain-containing protein [Xylariaceae sp. FL1651]
MKFAKELEQDLVPEWRIKYLNYKAGKKYVKAVSRAINRANATPRGLGRKSDPPPPHEAPSFFRSPFARQQQPREAQSEGSEDADPLTPLIPSAARPEHTPRTEPANVPASRQRQSLTSPSGNEANYGSFVHSPPANSTVSKVDSRQTFELPAPALQVPPTADDKASQSRDPLRRVGASNRLTPQRSASADTATAKRSQVATLPRLSPSSHLSPPGRLRRLFSHGQQLNRTESAKVGYDMQAIDTVRQRERDFFDFLDSELDKVETFYRQKEVQAGDRLDALREQLHEMRNRRTQEVAELRRRKEYLGDAIDDSRGKSSGFDGHHKWIDPIKSKLFKPGTNSKALAKMPHTPVFGARSGDAKRDYIRKSHEHDVPYRTAKRKLKLALQEFYRGLELLKSYAILNRTAFRKLNKKYDKAVNARPPYRYMNEKVNKAWFVNSELIDGHIRAVEDLYARYFEKGNHKIAAGKLRRVNRRPGDESSIAFRNGLFIGIGAVFTIQGLIYGAQLLLGPDPVIRLQTSYLLQIYAGYFLILFLFSLFCLDCYIWTANKINYPFIFEFDPRHHLDWRQLASFPSFFLLLFGVFFWLNFTRYGADELWLYYPVILIFISLVIILLPAPILWHRSRLWLAYSHYRLFFAGLYPVEFRDFFLGDIYCSLTYATSNVELFFCLYAHYWKNPTICNSNHSRLLGFFSALPPIWRALQCIRRYYDTKNVFPHLVNCGKYAMTILAAVTLSLYRISGTNSHLALFVTFSTLNGIYTSVWDLFMDFSLLQADARHRFLRDILGLKRHWVYYGIMIIDPILRFGWIFYAIFTYDKQHSTIVSFLVALAEVTRRGMWALFRVENEHCSNVAQYKASRDVPLPYELQREPLIERMSTEDVSSGQEPPSAGLSRASTRSRDQRHTDDQQSALTPVPLEEGGLRRRQKPELTRAMSIRGLMADAHRQDFEKKRRPPVEAGAGLEAETADEFRSDDDEEEDEDDTGSMVDERMEVRRVETLVRGEENEDEQ